MSDFATTSVFKKLKSIDSIIPREVLLDSSISEYADILPCGKYRGVIIDALDMSSGSKTGTFKDWAACATIAYCKHHQINKFVTQSSGNTANALAAYCSEFNQNVTIFYILSNSTKLKPQFFCDQNVLEIIAVDGSEARLKELTKEYSDSMEVPWLPRLEIQDLANSVRADFVLDYIRSCNIFYDWHSQSLSSGYGVFGFYKGLQRIGWTKGFKFLGVQQSRVSPFVNYFNPDEFSDIKMEEETLIEPTLFRSNPTQNLYIRMQNIIDIFGGDFSLVTNQNYENYLDISLKILLDSGISITKNDKNEIIEKSGLINLIGVLKSIDNNIISQGERVLFSITGGCGKGPYGDIIPTRILT